MSNLTHSLSSAELDALEGQFFDRAAAAIDADDSRTAEAWKAAVKLITAARSQSFQRRANKSARALSPTAH